MLTDQTRVTRNAIAPTHLGLAAAIVCVFSLRTAVADRFDVQVLVDDVDGDSNELDGLGETVEVPARYRRCFANGPVDGATVTVAVGVGKNGKAGSIAFVGSPPRRVKACLRRVIRRLRFPRNAAHPRSVTFTLTVGPEHEGIARALALIGEDEDPLGIAGGSNVQVGGQPPSPPTPTPPTVTVVEGYTLVGPDVVESALVKIRSAYAGGFGRCYRESPAAAAEWTGDVYVTFTIDETGRARHDSVSGGDYALAHCIAAHSDAWRFAPPSEPVTMRVRFHFDPK